MELEEKLRQQQIEFQQQLKQKDEDIQAIKVSSQQEVVELMGQLQQKDQQMQDELLQRGEQITSVEQHMEARQQEIERQLKGEADQLARVKSELAENAQQLVNMDRWLLDKDQQLEQKNEKRLGDIERKQLEEKQEIGRQVDRKIQEGHNQTRVEIDDLRMRIGLVETSRREEQVQVKELLEKSNETLRRKPGELMGMPEGVDWRRIELSRLAPTGSLLRMPVLRLTGLPKVSVQTHVQQGCGQAGEDAYPRERFEQEQTSRKEQDQLKELNGKLEKSREEHGFLRTHAPEIPGIPAVTLGLGSSLPTEFDRQECEIGAPRSPWIPWSPFALGSSLSTEFDRQEFKKKLEKSREKSLFLRALHAQGMPWSPGGPEASMDPTVFGSSLPTEFDRQECEIGAPRPSVDPTVPVGPWVIPLN